MRSPNSFESGALRARAFVLIDGARGAVQLVPSIGRIDLVDRDAALRASVDGVERTLHRAPAGTRSAGRAMQFGIEPAAETARPELRHIGGGLREEADGVQRRRERHRAIEGEQAEAGFEAADAAEGCRAQHAAQRLRAQREGDHAGGDRGRGARGTAAGRVAGKPRIARRSRIEGRERRGPRLAEQHARRSGADGDDVRVVLALAPS